MTHLKYLLAAAALLSLAVLAQPARPAASQVLLDHYYKAIVNWDKGQGQSASAGLSAMSEMDFLRTRSQLRELGTSAYPLAPKVADQMLASLKNKYVLGFMVMDMTPTTSDSDVPQALAQVNSGNRAAQLVAVAQLSKAATPAAFSAVRATSAAEDATMRLMGTIGLGYVGRIDPESAARAIAPRLKDGEKATRSAAANSIRLIGAPAAVVAGDVIEYLRSRDNLFAATAALKALPVDSIRPAKAELEAILADPKYGPMLKGPVAELLVRMERRPSSGGSSTT